MNFMKKIGIGKTLNLNFQHKEFIQKNNFLAPIAWTHLK